MTKVPYIVDGDGVVYHSCERSDEEIRDMIRFGSAVVVFRQTVAGIQYADVDPITHEIEWKTTEVLEE